MIRTGLVRKLDDCRRIMIPKDLCDRMLIREGDAYEILIDGDTLILSPYDETKRALEHAVMRLKHQIMKKDISHKAEMLVKCDELYECIALEFKRDEGDSLYE